MGFQSTEQDLLQAFSFGAEAATSLIVAPERADIKHSLWQSSNLYISVPPSDTPRNFIDVNRLLSIGLPQILHIFTPLYNIVY